MLWYWASDPVQSMMKTNWYFNVFKRKINPETNKSHRDEPCFFQHDSSPCNKLKILTKFLRDNKVKVLDWPGNSTDLNHIEKLCKILK